jgi:DNA-binding response OmpR family regulator
MSRSTKEVPMTSTVSLLGFPTDGWDRVIYGFLTEKHRLSGSDRTVDAYSRILKLFFDKTDKPPDVVLLDIPMPGMDGLETLRRLKDQPESSSLPVIMVTAQGDRQNMVKAVQLGVRDYVTKPWEPGEVEMCVNWALKAANVSSNQQEPPLLAESA